MLSRTNRKIPARPRLRRRAEEAGAELGRGAGTAARDPREGGAQRRPEAGTGAVQGLWPSLLPLETFSCCSWHRRSGLLRLLGSVGVSCEVFFSMKRLTVTVRYISFQANSRTTDGTLAKVENQAGGSVCGSSPNPLHQPPKTPYRPRLRKPEEQT